MDLDTQHRAIASRWIPGALRDGLGYVASALVLATFSVRSMRRLRCLAILSNVAFISYAAGAGLLPILILHAILLPTNCLRLLQLERGLPQAEPVPVRRKLMPFAAASWPADRLPRHTRNPSA